jgi:uncharacterized protein (TIGR02266 family)
MTEQDNDNQTGRRKEPRVTINKEFESVEKFITEYVSNISRSGAFIRTKQPLPAGTKVQLRFTVIMNELETIEGIGEVVRIESGDAERNIPSGMGVVFTQLDHVSQKLIENLITRQASE